MSEPNPDKLAPSGGTSSQSLDRITGRTRTLGTLAHLLVGSALLGRDAIGSAMAFTANAAEEASNLVPVPDYQAANGDSPAATSDAPRPSASPHHLLIGALFDTGGRIERRGESALRLVGKATSPAVRWGRQSRLTAPARHRFDASSALGEARIRR